MSFTDQLSAFLQAERQQESGGNYTASNPSGASGAYQYIQSTWSSEATAAGYGQYASAPAANAPPSVQDAVAAYNATNLYKEYGNWTNVAEAWYYPAWAGNPAYQDQIPYPSAGNTQTIGEYGANVTSKMNTILGGGTIVTTAASSSSSSSSSSGTQTPGAGFLSSLNSVLNPSSSLNPFTDVGQSINMIIVRGGLALIGIIMVLAGLSIIVLGSVGNLGKSLVRSAIT